MVYTQEQMQKKLIYSAIDLASFIFGSSVVAVTNNNFETAFRMIKPDPVKNVSSKGA